MKKTIAITIVVVLIITGIIFFIFSSGERGTGVPPAASSTGNPPPIATSTPPITERPTGNTFQIGTAKGVVTINNFYKNPAQVSQDATSIIITQNNAYNITYYTPDSSFNIGISKGPVSVTRAEAEAAFLTVLGISQADACKLNVIIGVPYNIDPNYADQNLGLSFCASSTFGG